MSWWYCLKHMRVEPDEGCAHAERMGPYDSEDAARHAFETARKRNEAYDAGDED